MFRTTCRLRDLVEKQHDGNKRAMEPVREVEFTCRDGTFPDVLRWEKFVLHYWIGKFYDLSWHDDNDCVFLGMVCPTLRSKLVESDPSSVKFHVLWLSPSVFISHYEFYVSGICRYDYVVGFEQHDWVSGKHGVGARFYVYQKSYFDAESEVDSPSLLPFTFFHHLTEFLPGDFFRKIAMKSGRCLPVTLHLRLLAIIPHDARIPTRTRKRSVTFQLENVATGDDIRQILAHPFHPSARLEFNNCSPFLKLVTLNEFNHLFRESQYLRAIKIPSQLVHQAQAASAEDTFSFKKVLLRSSRLAIRFEGTVSFSLLHQLAAFYRIIDIKIETSHDLQRSEKLFRSCLDPHLHEDSLLEQLDVRFRDIHCWQHPPIEFSPCFSRKLHFVSISYYEYPSPEWRSVDEVEQWDVSLFPSVVLNCYRNRLYKRLDGGTLALAIKAVNEGQVYRRSTNHAPFNMSVSNVGLIFYLVRMRARGQAGYGGSNWEGLPPTKRPKSGSSHGTCQRGLS
jgi:hypothetical protein